MTFHAGFQPCIRKVFRRRRRRKLIAAAPVVRFAAYGVRGIRTG
ncbi:MAG: hypothetical protein RLY31_3026 [Bacteroidota bacterium]